MSHVPRCTLLCRTLQKKSEQMSPKSDFNNLSSVQLMLSMHCSVLLLCAVMFLYSSTVLYLCNVTRSVLFYFSKQLAVLWKTWVHAVFCTVPCCTVLYCGVTSCPYCLRYEYCALLCAVVPTALYRTMLLDVPE